MGNKRVSGAEAVFSVLEKLGIEVVFGLPGTQTLPLFEAMRRSGLRTVLCGSESAAAFAAGGYYRACGRPAAVVTIPGPGFTNTLTGLAEARHDSAALMLLTVRSTAHELRWYRLQELDLGRVSGPIVKACFRISEATQVASTLCQAYVTAAHSEPGPVLVEIDDTALSDIAPLAPAEPPTPVFDVDDQTIDGIAERLTKASRPLLFCGQGAATAAELVEKLIERCKMPVVTTGSGRGVLPEDRPFSLRYDFSGGAHGELNELIEVSDLVLAVGCKFSHNGSAGFKLAIPPEKLIHVDTSAEALGANYPAEVQVHCDAGVFLNRLLKAGRPDDTPSDEWTQNELDDWRKRFTAEVHEMLPHVPPLNGVNTNDCGDLFRALRRKLPRDTILVTDSGYHQVLSRAFWEVRSPRGLLAPSDFQSMGFALPAAIGAALGDPGRRIVAVIGDGGLIMSGMELLTAVREKLPLTVLLFNDGSLGQIRMEQLRAYGHDHDTRLLGPDMADWCQSIGANYVRLEGDLDTVLDQGLEAEGVTIIEADIADSPELGRMQRRGMIKSGAKRLVGPGLIAKLKRLLRRRG